MPCRQRRPPPPAGQRQCPPGGRGLRGVHELGLLVGRLEAAVAELRRRVDELEVDLLQRDARALRKERPGLKIRNPDAVEEWSNAEVFLHVTLTSDVTNLDDVQKKTV